MNRVALPLSIALVVTCAALAACGPVAARPREVEARITDFLVAVRNHADGLGWDHLRADVRASYPGGRAAWIQAMEASASHRLMWRIEDISVDDFVGCARVDFGASRQHVPSNLFAAELPPMARVASRIDESAFLICATTGPFPFDAGVHGVG